MGAAPSGSLRHSSLRQMGTFTFPPLSSACASPGGVQDVLLPINMALYTGGVQDVLLPINMALYTGGVQDVLLPINMALGKQQKHITVSFSSLFSLEANHKTWQQFSDFSRIQVLRPSL